MKKVTIITVNYNGRKDTLEFLASLKKLDSAGLETKIVVVDNGSTDNSVPEILEKYPKITLLQTGQNLGFTGGFNRGLRYGLAWDADYLLIINNDTLINSPNLIEKLIKTADSDQRIGIVAPKIYFAPGFEFHKDRYKRENLGKVIWFAGGSFDWQNVMSVHHGLDEVDNGQFNQVEEVEFISGCCLLIKRGVLEKIGFFEEKLFAYMEDNDFLERAKSLGYKLYYDGTVNIYHKVSQTVGIGSSKADYYLTRNRLFFGFKYANFKTKFAIFRQALGFLPFGRPLQKKGVIDFFLNKFGPLEKELPDPDKVIYPKLLSIVSSNYNTAELFKNLIESISDKKSGFDPKTMEAIMLDDASPEDPEPTIKHLLPKIQFYKNIKNLGFTRSFNRLIHLSSGKFILLLNSDMEILEGALTELIKTEENLDGNTVLGGRLYFPDMRSQDSVQYLPTPWGAIKEYFFNIKGSYFMYVPKPEVLTKVEAIVGACMLIPQAIFNKIGFLTEEVTSYFEDLEYCRRLKKNNIPIYFVPQAKFIHHHGASFKKLGSQTLEIHQESAKKYHGKLGYLLIYITLWLCQKLTRKRPPGSM